MAGATSPANCTPYVEGKMSSPAGAYRAKSTTFYERPIALPTPFDGHVFKSRDEARWAVFCKTFGVPYEYEPQGFKLSDGSCYSPDFWFPSMRFWGECKPTHFYPDEETKCRLLANQTGFPCLFLIGPPDFKAYTGATWDCGNYTVVPYSLDIDNHWKLYEQHRLFSDPSYDDPPRDAQFSSAYRHAIYSSRGYKFEGVL